MSGTILNPLGAQEDSSCALVSSCAIILLLLLFAAYRSCVQFCLLVYRTVVSPHSTTMPKVPKKNSKITFYTAPQDEKTTKYRYTLFSADSTGKLSQKTSALTAVTRAPKPGNADVNNDSVVSQDTHTSDNSNNDIDPLLSVDPLLDPAYIQHLEDTGSNEKIKRIRMKGVR